MERASRNAKSACTLMSKAAILGAPLLALVPEADASITLSTAATGNWSAASPAALTAATGITVGSATLKVSGGTGLKVTNIQTAAFTRILGYVYLTGVAASYTGATVVGFGLTLPSNGASGWLVSTSRSLPNSLVLDGSYPAVYAGIRIKGTSQTTYYWIQVDPSPTAVEILDYGTFAASGSGSSSGGGSNGSSSGTGTPEPAAGGLALLALGAAGVLRRRRQKEQATQ